ncbi:MAG: ATP-binding protein [Sutterella seckii]
MRRDREDLKTLRDLRGKRVAAVVDEPSPGILEVKREVARLNADPDDFFGSIQTVPRLRMKEVLSHVLSGRADAGILRGCFLEDLWKAGNRTFEAEIRVLDAKRGDGLACRHSTALYPGWTVAASERLSQDAARAVTAVLLTKPANAWGQYWTVSTNTSSYTDLMKTLRIGAYAYLREWTLSRVWDEYRPFILVAIVALLGLLAHSAILEKLVRRRTEELERVHAGQQAAERHAREMTERLDQLQRAGAVGQISSIVAHEMKQPLAVIQNLSRGTIRMIEDEPETLDEVSKAVESINDEAGRAAAIIDRVRTYSQGRSERRAVEFSDALHDAVTQFRATRRGRLARIVFGRIDRGEVWIDPLDLELIIINLLANAVDAAKNVEDPRVFVELLRIPGSPASEATLELHVSDNGPRISDDAFDALGKRLLKSTKPGGLGLGLSIVRTLAENCVGRLSFERSGGDGITAVVALPVMNSKDAKSTSSGRGENR